MPGLAQRNDQFSNGSSQMYSLSSSANGFWSKHREDVSFNLLQKVLDSLFCHIRFHVFAFFKVLGSNSDWYRSLFSCIGFGLDLVVQVIRSVCLLRLFVCVAVWLVLTFRFECEF